MLGKMSRACIAQIKMNRFVALFAAVAEIIITLKFVQYGQIVTTKVLMYS